MEERFCRPVRIYILDRGVSRLKTKGQKKRSVWGEKFQNPELETIFSEDLFRNPNLHQIHTNTQSAKSKGAFSLFSIFLYCFLPQGRGVKNRQKQVWKGFTKFRGNRIIYIDFFLPIVYDKIASYGVPNQWDAPQNNKKRTLYLMKEVIQNGT